MMRVWKIEATGQYCGGMAIVAAPTIDSATTIGGSIKNHFDINYGKPDSVDELPELTAKESGVICHYEMGE
jgi:hypothetical protein